MSTFSDKRIEVSTKLLDAINEALDKPTSKNPEHLVLLAQAFAHVSEHGRAEPQPKIRRAAVVTP